MKLHHVGVLCDNRQMFAIKQILALIGIDAPAIAKQVREFQCDCYLMGQIEFVVPYGGKLLDRYSEVGISIHHFAIQVENLESICTKLIESGMSLVCAKSVIGVGDILVNFIHPLQLGIMIELVEVPE